MTIRDLIDALAGGQTVFIAIGLAVPVLIFVWGFAQRDGQESRLFGHVASSAIAVGLVAIVIDVAAMMTMRNGGASLLDAPALPLLTPFWLGFGSLFAATRRVSFAHLRTYPLLRRVWAILSIVGLVMVVWMILKHTFLVVWTSVIGFVILALVVWSLFRMLARRAMEPAPEGGDPDLLDDVADDSKRRVGGFFSRIGKS